MTDERVKRLMRQATAIEDSWCEDEGHDWVRLPAPELGAPTVVLNEVPVKWCRNCGRIERDD